MYPAGSGVDSFGDGGMDVEGVSYRADWEAVNRGDHKLMNRVGGVGADDARTTI